MTDEKALTVRPNMPDVMTLGATLAKSGYFQDADDAAKAVVKVLAGQELGIPPIAAMTGIYIVKGHVSLSANLMASLVKRSGRYDYRVIALTDKMCELAFFEQGKEVGRSMFTAEDARRAGTQNMDKFPRNMIFARAISNGVKWYCPDVTNGPVYTPEELGETVDGETGEIVNGPKWAPATVQAGEEPPPVVAPPPAQPEHDKKARPWSAEIIRGAMRKKSSVWAKGMAGDWSDAEPVGHDGRRKPASEGQVKGVVSIMAAAITRDGMMQAAIDADRHAILSYIFDVASTNDLCAQECGAILDLWKAAESWEPNEYAAAEAAAIITAWQKMQGQAELL